ncbi:MAG: GYD domain-containing protein [Actinomycetota bacterium]|nr:GYD domain-containing protein [Actinomycetota bacterium]
MPKILWRASYTVEGAKGLLREGGTSRRQAVERLVESAGGRVEAFYFAFGEDDTYTIIDVPDNTTAAAVSMAIYASGAVRVNSIPLLTPEEIDEAAKKQVEYRPPGA